MSYSDLMPIGSRWRWTDRIDGRTFTVIEHQAERDAVRIRDTMTRRGRNWLASSLLHRATRLVATQEEAALCVLQGVKAEVEKP